VEVLDFITSGEEKSGGMCGVCKDHMLCYTLFVCVCMCVYCCLREIEGERYYATLNVQYSWTELQDHLVSMLLHTWNFKGRWKTTSSW